MIAPAHEAIAVRARRAVADKIEVPLDEVHVVSVEDVTWSDGSLGCPQPGFSYTQALVPGYRVALEHAGRTHFVHADIRDNGAVIVCAKPKGGFLDET